MRFIIAPEWFMKLNDDDVLCSKQVLDLYGYSIESRGVNILIKKGHLPIPDKEIQRKRSRLIRWTVGYLKNYVKLPTELNILP